MRKIELIKTGGARLKKINDYRLVTKQAGLMIDGLNQFQSNNQAQLFN